MQDWESSIPSMKQPSRVESDIPIIGVLNGIIGPIVDKSVKEDIFH
jgi:hypothetical protein